MKMKMTKFVSDQYTTVPIPTADLTGRVVVITGSNTGLGYEAALQMSHFNPSRLILAVRNLKSGADASAKIAAANGGVCTPEVWQLDQGDLESVKTFAGRLDKELDRLDILIANAGVQFEKRVEAAFGYETTVFVNNIATSLLATLTVPIIKKTAALPNPAGASPFKPHLIITSSELHLLIKELPGQKEGKIIETMKDSWEGGGPRYMQSKAINMLDVGTLTKIVADDSIVIAAVNPGWCYSALGRDVTGPMSYIVPMIMKVLARSTEAGGRTLVWAATSSTIKSGDYSSLCQVEEASDLSLSAEGKLAGDQIWKEYEKIWKDKAGVDAREVLGGSV